MNRAVLIAVLAFLIYGVQVSEQQICSRTFCRNQFDSCGCNGCCVGRGFNLGGECNGRFCWCYRTERKIAGPSGGGPSGGD